MGKYQPLEEHLRYSGKASVTLSCAEIEGIIGESLPASSAKHRAWWANDRTHVHARAWLDAGYRLTDVTLGISATFERT